MLLSFVVSNSCRNFVRCTGPSAARAGRRGALGCSRYYMCTPCGPAKLIQPDDWHHHLRDGPALATTVPAAARQFQRAIIMPNLVPPVTTTQMQQSGLQSGGSSTRSTRAARPTGIASSR